MAGSVNKVILIGNLGQDPKIGETQQGLKWARLSVATSKSYKDKSSGDRKERTSWHTVVIWNEKLAEIAEKYAKKGTTVYIEGELETRKYQKDGLELYATEVVLNGYSGTLQLVGGKQGGGGAPDPKGPDDYGSTSSKPMERPRAGGASMDDDIPFAARWEI